MVRKQKADGMFFLFCFLFIKIEEKKSIFKLNVIYEKLTERRACCFCTPGYGKKKIRKKFHYTFNI